MKDAGTIQCISIKENYFMAWFNTDKDSRYEAPNQRNYGSCNSKDKQEVSDT